MSSVDPEPAWPAPRFAFGGEPAVAYVEPLLGPRPRVSKGKLALYLARPAIEGGFRPDVPWQGISLIRDTPVLAFGSDPRELDRRFADAVERTMGRAQHVAVLFSGGLDSGAVLAHAAKLCRAQGRQLSVVVLDGADDEGNSPVPIARRLMRALDLEQELHVIDALSVAGGGEVCNRWDPVGPDTASYLGPGAAAGALAEELGAELLLTGHGADELLCVPRFAAARLARQGGLRTGLRYLQDVVSRGGTAPAWFEACSAVGPRVMRHPERLYWAVTWPGSCRWEATDLLAPAFHQRVVEWSRAWVADRLARLSRDTAWWIADLEDSMLPYDPQLGPSGVRHASPYHEGAFIQYALGLPAEARYDAGLRTPYHRRKTLVVRLYPWHVRDGLPSVKQYFSATAQAVRDRSDTTFRRCAQLGLVSRPPRPGDPEEVVETLGRIERWLAGADDLGAVYVD